MSVTPALLLQGLTKRYGTKVALQSLDLQVEPGQIFGLIGPNGAGKTTTFSLLCGFLFPDSGSVRVMGVDPTRPGALKGKVGALPQDSQLPSGWTLGALLTYWARLSLLDKPENHARAALEDVGLLDAWKVQTQTLSHGMAKRAAMAQALMGEPPLVLLDEPTAGLDPKVAAQVRQRIKAMQGRQTVVVSSHNLQELEEICDAAAILDRGQLAQAGSLSELTAQHAEFRVHVVGGEIPLDAVRALPAITSVTQESPGVLLVRFSGVAARPEEAISRVVSLLLAQGLLLLSVSRGHKLEQRVLQLL